MNNQELENEIIKIKERNRKVELDKAWETSWTRKICICILTYIVVLIYSSLINKINNIWLSSLVPVIGFTLSTFSLKLIRNVWEKNNLIKENNRMENLINNLKQNSAIIIKGKEYIVKTKTWYSIEEDETASYIKCELSDNRMLVVIPDDELVYIGQVIENMQYKRISDTVIQYEDMEFTKTGDGHQFIKNIEFGNENEVEGKCMFEDYESRYHIISLGILPEKDNKRADVYADILEMEDIKMK